MTEPLVIGVGLVLAVAGHDLLRYPVGRLDVPVLSREVVGSDLRKWLVAGVLVGYVVTVEGKGLASVGVRGMDPLAFAAWVVGGVALAFVLGGVAAAAPDRYLRAPTGFVAEQGGGRSVAGWGFTAVTAGITESLLYQGYPIERLAGLVGLPAAATVSLVLFTAVHYVGDAYSLREVLYISASAAAVTLLYALTRNLAVVVAVHTLVNSISLATAHYGASGTAADDEDQSTSGSSGTGQS